MKRNIIVSIALIFILLQGCIVRSLHPFFTERDVTSRNEFLNTWTDQDGGQWSIKPFKDKPGAYEMHWLHNGERDVVMLAQLFKLNEEMYLDFVPLADNSEGDDMPIFNLHLLPTHSVAKVLMVNKDEIQIKWFNEKWMQSLFEQNRIKISHEVVYDQDSKDKNDKMYILTASTEELQKFIIKYGGEDKAFDSNDNTLWLRLKRSN